MLECLHDFLGPCVCSFVSALGLGRLAHDPNEDCPMNLALKSILGEVNDLGSKPNWSNLEKRLKKAENQQQ
jgi:hypothetical protein